LKLEKYEPPVPIQTGTQFTIIRDSTSMQSGARPPLPQAAAGAEDNLTAATPSSGVTAAINSTTTNSTIRAHLPLAAVRSQK
jgi:hypothetical protein